MKHCIFTIGSITYAQKAKKTLSQKKIQSRIVKTDGLENSGGCAYGIEFDCAVLMSAVKELKERGIDYKYLE